MSEYEKALRKYFFNMTHMVKVLYEERNSRLQGESSKPSKGEGSPRGKGGDKDKPLKGKGDKPLSSSPSSSPPSSPSSSSSSTTTLSQEASAESPSKKEDGQVCTYCLHDEVDDVRSVPKSKDLKEERLGIQ